MGRGHADSRCTQNAGRQAPPVAPCSPKKRHKGTEPNITPTHIRRVCVREVPKLERPPKFMLLLRRPVLDLQPPAALLPPNDKDAAVPQGGDLQAAHRLVDGHEADGAAAHDALALDVTSRYLEDWEGLGGTGYWGVRGVGGVRQMLLLPTTPSLWT